MANKLLLGTCLLACTTFYAQDSISGNKQSDLVERFEQITGKDPNYLDTIRVLKVKLATSQSTIEAQQDTIDLLQEEVLNLQKFYLIGKYGQDGKWTAYGKSQVDDFKKNNFLKNYNLTYPGLHIYFAFEEKTIPLELYKDEIQSLVDQWKKNPKQKMVIEGYTDTWGNMESNRNYSQDRALFVKAYLLSLQVPETAIEFYNEGILGVNRYKEREMDFLNRQVILKLK